MDTSTVTPELIAGADGFTATCPVCGQRIPVRAVPRSAQEVADTPLEAARIRVGLLGAENPTDAAGLRRVDKALEHVHTDVDLEPWRRHVGGHR